MKIAKLSALLVLATTALSSCSFSKGGGGGGSGSTWKDYDKYYSGYKIDTRTGADLIQEIHYYFVDKHNTYVTYGKYWTYNSGGKLDKDFSGTGEGFYTGRTNVTSGVDREHVWPCACSNDLWYRSTAYVEHQIDNASYFGGGSDLFHIRPAYSDVNEARSSGLFYEFTAEERADRTKTNYIDDTAAGAKYGIWIDDLTWTKGSSTPSTAKKVEVADAFKGDVARIIMYLWTHYRNIGEKNVYYSSSTTWTKDPAKAQAKTTTHTPDMFGPLPLTNILAYNNLKECYQLLKRWNAIDAPSDVEKNRNNLVQAIQGNRNPFIDYPQLVDNCLDELIEQAS